MREIELQSLPKLLPKWCN